MKFYSKFYKLNFIKAITNQILDLAYNFDKVANYLDLNTPYDIKSIMHYDSYSFMRYSYSFYVNNTPRYTILSNTEPHVIERNFNLSHIDIKEIQMLYNCMPGNF